MCSTSTSSTWIESAGRNERELAKWLLIGPTLSYGGPLSGLSSATPPSHVPVSVRLASRFHDSVRGRFRDRPTRPSHRRVTHRPFRLSVALPTSAGGRGTSGTSSVGLRSRRGPPAWIQSTAAASGCSHLSSRYSATVLMVFVTNGGSDVSRYLLACLFLINAANMPTLVF
jgi:hypothetical protein